MREEKTTRVAEAVADYERKRSGASGKNIDGDDKDVDYDDRVR